MQRDLRSLDLRAEEWPLLDSAVTGWKAESSCVEVSLSTAECPHCAVLEMLHTHGNSESCCFSWYISADFSFSVVAYTDTQHAQFLKLSSSKRNANTNSVEAPPHTHSGTRFCWLSAETPEWKAYSERMSRRQGSACTWICMMWF